jgi:hypothetical protein
MSLPTSNGINGYSTDAGIKKALDTKTGNVADMNLLLTLILQEVGIEAYPVLLSTRSHGRVKTFYPTYEAFNYVICMAKTEQGAVLLDATNSLGGPGILPYQCLNGEGLMIKDENTFSWVPLQSSQIPGQVANSTLTLSNEGILSGQVQVIKQGMLSVGDKASILEKSEKDYIQNEWENQIEGFEIKSYELGGIKEQAQPLKVTLKVESEDLTTGGRIYLSPVFTKVFEENPFKADERKYPVDFGYPIKETYTLTITLPEGYEVEELPKNMSFVLPDKSATFQYVVAQSGNTIQLRNAYARNKTMYLPEEYKALREFCTQIIAKQTEQIVLKKK